MTGYRGDVSKQKGKKNAVFVASQMPNSFADEILLKFQMLSLTLLFVEFRRIGSKLNVVGRIVWCIR